jgi:hypothetical protein
VIEEVPFLPTTVAEFFFADDRGELPSQLDLQEVDLLYNDYIRVMSCMHERLRSVYNQYVTKFLDEKMRTEHFIEADTSRLILPGEEGTDGECDFSKMFEDNRTQAKTVDTEPVKPVSGEVACNN